MRKCGKNLKIALLMGTVYVALMAVLLTGISYAKYQETRMAYANFGAASFNSVILSVNEDDTVKAFDVFDQPLQISDYRPGMTYDSVDPTKNTAKMIDFAVANGVNAENASEANVQYQIALRTTGHLPLKYSLLHKKTNEKIRYTAGEEKTRIAPESDIATVWYEQRFYETVEGGEREVTFDLDGGILDINEYALIVEWPTGQTVNGVRTDDARYMKEVELLQILVTASSKNMLEVPGYIDSGTDEIEYGNGIVILDPNKGTEFVHSVDYRAFREEDDTTFYTLTIENGWGKQVTQTVTETTYTVEIEVPWTTDTKKFQYSLKKDGTEVALTSAGYRLYDELYNSAQYGGAGYNTYVNYNVEPTGDEIAGWSKTDSEKRLYQVFTIPEEKLSNVALEEYDSAHDAHEYQLVLSGDGTANISSDLAFEHKIKILVSAEYSGATIVPAATEEGGGENG